MIYVELQLSGKVQVYEMTDKLVLLRAIIQTRAECLPLPQFVSDAHDYMRASCYQLEMFQDLEDVQIWASGYNGFRAGEVRAELARFLTRRADYCPLSVVAA